MHSPNNSSHRSVGRFYEEDPARNLDLRIQLTRKDQLLQEATETIRLLRKELQKSTVDMNKSYTGIVNKSEEEISKYQHELKTLKEQMSILKDDKSQVEKQNVLLHNGLKKLKLSIHRENAETEKTIEEYRKRVFELEAILKNSVIHHGDNVKVLSKRFRVKEKERTRTLDYLRAQMQIEREKSAKVGRQLKDLKVKQEAKTTECRRLRRRIKAQKRAYLHGTNDHVEKESESLQRIGELETLLASERAENDVLSYRLTQLARKVNVVRETVEKNEKLLRNETNEAMRRISKSPNFSKRSRFSRVYQCLEDVKKSIDFADEEFDTVANKVHLQSALGRTLKSVNSMLVSTEGVPRSTLEDWKMILKGEVRRMSEDWLKTMEIIREQVEKKFKMIDLMESKVRRLEGGFDQLLQDSMIIADELDEKNNSQLVDEFRIGDLIDKYDDY